MPISLHLLRQEIDSQPGYQLAEVRFDKTSEDKIMVYAVVRGPKVISSEQVAQLESWLPPSPSEKEVKLQIRFVQTVTITPEGVLLNNTDDEKPVKSQMTQ